MRIARSITIADSSSSMAYGIDMWGISSVSSTTSTGSAIFRFRDRFVLVLLRGAFASRVSTSSAANSTFAARL